MKRRAFLAGLLVGGAFAGPALAQGLVDDIIAQLRRQRFQTVTTERTLLGRVRILATRDDGAREIIVNPRTGEILRDLWTPVSGGKAKVEIIDDRSGRDTDEDDDDDEDEDNSGSGSSGSGGDDDDDEAEHDDD
jgi:hypothetical protein